MKTNNKLKMNDNEDEILIAKMLSKYYPYWPVFFMFIILSTVASYLYIKFSAPKYEATASIIIKDEKKGNEESKLLESLNMMNSKKIIENEIEVLQSTPIIEMVVKKMHLYAPIFIKGELVDYSAYSKSPLIVECDNSYSNKIVSEKISFNYNKETNEVWIGNKHVGRPGQWIRTKYGMIRFLLNPRYLSKAPELNKYYFQLTSIQNAAESVIENLKISSSNKLSSIINLKYRDKDPSLCEDILNSMLDSYNELAVGEKNMMAKKTLSFIEDRLDIVGADLESIEKKIQQYKITTGAVEIEKNIIYNHIFDDDITAL